MQKIWGNTKGNSVVLAIFVTTLLICALAIINMAMGPVLMEIVSVSNSFMADNPSQVASEWRVNLNNSLNFYAASTGILIFSLIIWCFISSTKKEWKTYYRR